MGADFAPMDGNWNFVKCISFDDWSNELGYAILGSFGNMDNCGDFDIIDKLCNASNCVIVHRGRNLTFC
jgi:hypothetical protein